ncbi:MAG: hypothetical protein DI585_00535 [Pseudomonas fluorescens]|nr:MAG: hypothetical protein DI585_00535 [Pseudomonas fluorescens]
MIKYALVALTFVLAAAGAQAQGFNLGSALQTVQQQLGSTPAGQAATQEMQNAVMQQALQQLAANPQILTQMANSLTPAQQTTLTQQALAAAQQILTPNEQAKLTAFATSTEGASIAGKLPQIVQQLAPTLMQMYATNSANGIIPAAGATGTK